MVPTFRSAIRWYFACKFYITGDLACPQIRISCVSSVPIYCTISWHGTRTEFVDVVVTLLLVGVHVSADGLPAAAAVDLGSDPVAHTAHENTPGKEGGKANWACLIPDTSKQRPDEKPSCLYLSDLGLIQQALVCPSLAR